MDEIIKIDIEKLKKEREKSLENKKLEINERSIGLANKIIEMATEDFSKGKDYSITYTNPKEYTSEELGTALFLVMQEIKKVEWRLSILDSKAIIVGSDLKFRTVILF